MWICTPLPGFEASPDYEVVARALSARPATGTATMSATATSGPRDR
jgi:hypothetical protein